MKDNTIFESVWIRGGQPVRTVWLQDKKGEDVSLLTWHTVATLQAGNTELTVGTAVGDAKRTKWIRVTGLIEGAAAGARGNIGWKLPDDKTIEIPLGLVSAWSEAWLGWRHGNLDDQGIATALGVPAPDKDLQKSIRIPVSESRSFGIIRPYHLVALLLIGLAIGFVLSQVFTIGKDSPTVPTHILPEPTVPSTPETNDSAKSIPRAGVDNGIVPPLKAEDSTVPRPMLPESKLPQ